MKKFLVTVAATLLLLGCGKKDIDVKALVSLAEQQCFIMDSGLSDDTMPRTFEGDSLVTSDTHWWCSGFFPGVCWYTYMLGANEQIKDLAIKQTAKLLDVEMLNREHDLGFQVMPSAVMAYKHTGDTLYLKTIRDAAAKLAARFSPVTGVIMSWNWGEEDYPVIIDNMMNLDLLTYASRLFDVPQWEEIAITHARTTIKNHFREDYSTYHLVNYNPHDGSIIRKQTRQGYADESSWSRGQGWGLYGYTMMYRETGVEEFLEQAEKIAAYILPLIKDRPVPAWDFCAPEDLQWLEDASAAALISSALFELCGQTGDQELSKTCLQEAVTILKALTGEKYLCKKGECAGFLLKHSTGSYPHSKEVDVPLTYADYYFMEALYRYSLLNQ